MIKQSQLARAWGVSRAYVNELVKKRGMPLLKFKTVNQATEWRELNASSKAPVRGNRVGKAAAPKTPPEPRGEPDGKSGGRGTSGAEKTQDGSLEAALQATVRVAVEAEWLVMDAMKQKDVASIPALLSIHNKAIESRFNAERTYREEMEKQGILIRRASGTEMWRQGFAVIINKMKRVPQNKAQLCNPQAPLVAFGVLEDAMNEILEAAQKVYEKFNVK